MSKTTAELGGNLSLPAPLPAPAPTQPVEPPEPPVYEMAPKRWLRTHRPMLANLAPIGMCGGAHLLGWLYTVTGVWPVWALLWSTAAVLAAVVVVARTGGRVWWGSAVGVLVWLLLAATAGLSDVGVFVLWTAALVRSVPFWRAHQARYQPQAADPDDPEEEQAEGEEPLTREQVLWRDEVVPNNSVYAHTELGVPERVAGGFRALIIGARGKSQFGRMVAGVDTISSAWGTGSSQVTVEETRPPDNSRAMLTIISSDDLLAATHFLEEEGAAIDPQAGLARVATFFDGHPAHAQFWTPSGGMQMGLIFGRTESGKTRYAETKFILAQQCAQLVAAVLDAQDGQSMPECLQAAQISAVGVEGVYRGLRSLLYLSQRRSQFLATVPWIDELGRERSGKAFLLPGDQLIDPATGRPFTMPGVWALFDELPLLLKNAEVGKDAVKMLGTAVMTMRKAGIGVEGIAQNIGLDYLVDQGLRSNLAGNVAGFRTKSSDDHHMVGLEADPSKLESHFVSTGLATPGLCYLNGPDARPRAKARGLICKDVYGLTLQPPAGRLDHLSLGWLEQYGDMVARGIEPDLLGDGTAAAVVAGPTQGDVEAAIEHVLKDGPLPVDQLVARIGGRVADCTLGQIETALAALVKAERLWRRGEVCQLLERVGV
ncbi:hypothetical protein [Nonomuraea sp. CA-141351]|uniref:hypothetical protein n=1 Tax=Nonomuraea sp. CA-141351 TaxID=3239996 RepID=UPI003D8A9F42